MIPSVPESRIYARPLTGPIVRISPHEVHIRDPECFLQLNSSTSKLDKYAWYYNFVAAPEAGVGTTSHDLHRTRRAAMAKYFSTANVTRLEPLIQTYVSKLMFRLEEHQREAKTVDLSNAYRCLATDVITEYALPRSRLMLDSPDFAAGYNRVLRDFTNIAMWHRHIPIIFPIFNAIPRWVIANMDPGPALAVIDNQKVHIFTLSTSNTFCVTNCSESSLKTLRPILLPRMVRAQI